jgi:hypothetical protein
LPRSPWRHDVADHGHRGHDQPASADPLERAERDQLAHVLGDPAERRADQEDHDRRLQDDPAPVEVAELSVHRPHDGRREQIRRHDPGEMLDPAEIADDRRQRRRDDRLIERRQQQHEHERPEDQAEARGLLYGLCLTSVHAETHCHRTRGDAPS